MARESGIQSICQREFKQQGGYILNLRGSPYLEKGTADLVGCYRGQFCAIEVKRPGEKASRIQLHRMRQVKEAGGWAIIASGRQDIIDLVRDIDYALLGADA